MKTYAEMKKEANDNYKELSNLKQENDSLRFELSKMIEGVPFDKRPLLLEKQKAIRAKRAKNDVKIQRLKVVQQLLENNKKIALFNDVMPIIFEVLRKYNGKRLGEKTFEKLKNEIKEKTNCSFYIHRNSYHIMPLNKEGYTTNEEIEVSPIDYETKLLDDNKVQIVTMEELCVIDTVDYIENVSEYADELERLKSKAKELQKELRDICSAYNHAVPAFMEWLDSGKTIY